MEEKDPLMELAEAESSSSEQSLPHGDGENNEGSENDEEDARLLSRYGLWLLIEKCTPTDRTLDEVIGRLLSMLFQWYCDTATLTQGMAKIVLYKYNMVLREVVKITGPEVLNV